MKKLIIAIAIVFVVFVAGILIIGRTFYPDNIAQTSESGGVKGLKTRIYKTEVSKVAEVVKEQIPLLSTYGSNWKIADTSESDGTYQIKVEVPVVMFTDDLEVTIKEGSERNVAEVNISSKSRVGKSDFGENARHVRKLLRSLDEKLKN